MRVRRLSDPGQFWTILAVCDAHGDCTLVEFLGGLGANLQDDGDHMLELLGRFAEQGPLRNTEISHQIEGHIWECIKGRVRVLWFYDEGRAVICTHGFVKDSRKTPRKHIEFAVRTREQYFAAKNDNNIQIEDD